MLVLVWLNVSLDPMVGKDKKGGRYWHVYTSTSMNTNHTNHNVP